MSNKCNERETAKLHSERNKKENIANTSSVFDSYFLCGRNDRDFFTFYGENNEQIIKLQLSGFGNINQGTENVYSRMDRRKRKQCFAETFT